MNGGNVWALYVAVCWQSTLLANLTKAVINKLANSNHIYKLKPRKVKDLIMYSLVRKVYFTMNA